MWGKSENQAGEMELLEMEKQAPITREFVETSI